MRKPRSYGNSIFNFMRNCQAVFQNNCAIDFMKFFFFLCLFTFEREEGARERGRQNLKQAPGTELSVHSMTHDLNPQAVRS